MICVDPSHHCAVVDILKDLSGINRVLFLRFLFRHAAQEIAYILMMAVWGVIQVGMIGILHPRRLI